MKKLISVLLVAVMLLSLVACVPPQVQPPTEPTEPTGPQDEPTDPKPTAPIDPEPTEPQPTEPLKPYYSFGPEEMVIAKSGILYSKHEGQIDGKDVYEVTSQGWNGEIWAEQTSHMLNSENVCTPDEVRQELIAKQYKYATITFQLSEGAQIGVYHVLPVISEDFVGEVSGIVFKDGGVMSRHKNYLEIYGDRFSVFSNGKKVEFGETIHAGQWYTFVCELQLDADVALWGADSYVNVSMTNGNSKPVYVSEIRYYTDNSYLTDYVTEDAEPEVTEPEVTEPLADYVELDATELVTYKPGADKYTNQGEVFGRTDVYGAELLANWSVEVAAKTTIAQTIYADSAFADWTAVRNNYKKNGYQYIAIDLALSEGATVRNMACLPPAVAGDKVATAGLTFTDGAPLSWSSLCQTEEQRSYFAVYCEGKEVKVGDIIEAGKWYTLVVKLLVNGNEYAQGEEGWSSVAFNVGNGKMIYFSTVRYYTNDTYKTDYVTATPDPEPTEPEATEPEATEPEVTEPEATLPAYDQMDATELDAYKPKTEGVYSNQGEVFGRTDVYGATLLANWSVEVVAKNTVPQSLYANSAFADWTAVRKNYKDNGYQYIAMDFALSEGATVRAIGCVPPTEAGGNVVTAGLTFTDGQPLAWSSTTKTDEQKACFAVYSEGKEVAVGDTIEAGKWYTVVIKLLVNGGEYGQGEKGWSNVSFNVGNGKMIYFSTVRYYRNDSFKTDYVK